MVINELHGLDTPVILNHLRSALLKVVRLQTTLGIPRPISKIQPVIVRVQSTDKRDGGSLISLCVLAQRVRQARKHVEPDVKGMERSQHRQVRQDAQVGQQAGRGDADIRHIVPDGLLGGVVVLQQVAALRLEAEVADHRGEALEVGGDGVEDASVEGGALGDVGRVEVHEAGHLGVAGLGPPDILEVLGEVLVREGLELGEEGEEGAFVAHVASDQGHRRHLTGCSQTVRRVLEMLAIGADGPCRGQGARSKD